MNKENARVLLKAKIADLESQADIYEQAFIKFERELNDLLIDNFYDPQDNSFKKKWSETRLKNIAPQSLNKEVLLLQNQKKSAERQKLEIEEIIEHWQTVDESVSEEEIEIELANTTLLSDSDFFELMKNFDVATLSISNSVIGKLSPDIGHLSSLKVLAITGCKLDLLPLEIGQLANLTSLDFSGNSIVALPSSIGLLSQLEKLTLESNQLKELPAELIKLKNLKELILTANNLKSLPSQIEQLISLEILDLRYNTELNKLPSGFRNLGNLQELNLSDNYFSKGDIPDLLLEISNLRNLRRLELVNIGVEEIPKQLARLENLEDLDLHYNQLSDLPNELIRLTSLKNLDICGNNFSHLPECVFELENLESIYAGENQIEFIDSKIAKLKNLKYLYIGKIGKGLSFETDDFDPTNKIQELPRSIKELANLRELDLTGNPLPIPEEILARINEPEAIITYYSTIKFLGLAKKPIHEAKAIIIGQGSVGKTSIAQQILYSIFDINQAKTEGISINKMQVDEIRINLWDFGGQEIMHATHQFFLTKRSLYMLVLDSRLTQEENRVEYWLKIIQSFGGESPVLIVGNKTDQHPLDIDRTGLQKKYPNIVGILETSAATGAGIEELKAAIAEQVNNLPHVRDILPDTWFTVKTKLEGLGRESNFITHDKYIDLCTENEVSDETSQRTLIGFLHDLGVVLHFQDDPRLEALGILNPQWVTNGVYKILNSHTLFQNKGVLTVSMLDEILNLPEYPRGKRLFIVDMMKKFELCYDIEPDKTFLVPDLLPKDEPATDGRENALAFQYHYPVLPSSVITRFIVRMNEYAQEIVWRSGVVLEDGGNTALVKVDIEDRKVFIWVSGDEHKRHDFLSKIRGQFDAIHKTISKLEVKEMVPVPGHPEAEPVDYDLLLQMNHNNVEVYPVLSNSKMILVNVKEMLNGVARELDRQRNNVTNFYIGGDIKDSTIIAGDENEVRK